jgi:hypothetical protein
MADIDEDDRRNLAAAIIQTRWKEHRDRVEEAEQEAAGDGAQLGADHELTEDEEKAMLVSRAQQLFDERRQLVASNMAQQRILSKVFADRRAQQDSAQAAADSHQLPADADAKYWELVAKLRADRTALENRRNEGQLSLQAYKEKNESVVVEAMQYEMNFRGYVKDCATRALFPRKNKPIPPKRVEQFMEEEVAMYEAIHDVRVQYVRLRNKADKLSKTIKKKENQNDGMHLIDFEQLKIENTNLNEKIEERNEDLLKLRKKATTTIHVLTHVKEKLEYVKQENTLLQKQVGELDDMLSALRDKLSHTKKDRDIFVNENLHMKEKMPMIGSEDLLLDYELRKAEIEKLRIEVVTLTNKHHELMQWIGSHQGQLEKLQQAGSML